jgi:putative RNA 2'-phosphotransferase
LALRAMMHKLPIDSRAGREKFEFQVLPRQNKFEFQVLPRQNKFEFQVLPRQNNSDSTVKTNTPEVNLLPAQTKLSKSLAWLLRHGAVECGLALDSEGYAALDQVLELLNARGICATHADLARLANAGNPQKQRFRLHGSTIRASYGHSMGTQIRYPIATPPDVLFHGTTAAAYQKILATSLQGMRRDFVHLTTDIALARTMAVRHGPPEIIRVNAAAAFNAGAVFYRANDSFWLTKSVAAAFISLLPNRLPE